MPKKLSFGQNLEIEQLRTLVAELQALRDHPPVVSKGRGKYEGDILGFVRGLRLSARVIYFLREVLSEYDYQISWGHLINSSGSSCSPECDIIVHERGHMPRWNGDDEHPVMDFRFVKSKKAKLVVSCKSKLEDIDKEYPKSLKKFGIRKIFLFAECCRDTRYKSLRKKARKAGYVDLYCLYFTKKDNSYSTDENGYIKFGNRIEKALG